MEALQYLKEKYEKEGNAIYFREPDLPMSTSLERICKYMQEYAESHTQAHTERLREQLESETESRKHWQSQAQRYHKYHKELNAALERVKELENELKLLEDTIKHQAERCLKLEAENARYRDRIGEALKFLQYRQQTTPGLGAPINILKQALEK